MNSSQGRPGPGGSEWVSYDDLPLEAQETLRVSAEEFPETIAERCRRFLWQIERVPTRVVIDRIMMCKELADSGHTWDSYRAWYLRGGDIPDHGTSRWPVLENDESEWTGDGYLFDGWHRLHFYIRAGDTTIPVLRSRCVNAD